jgi:hypothetical protein
MTHKTISARTKLVLPFLCCTLSAFSQERGTNAVASAPPVRARAVLGLEGNSKNALGTLAIENDALVCRIKQGGITKIPIASIQDVNLSQQDKQIGGIALTLGKAAVPYGGGRAIGLFSHKKYDFVTMSYVDSSGGLRGAIWQLNTGRIQDLAKELTTREVRISRLETKYEAK